MVSPPLSRRIVPAILVSLLSSAALGALVVSAEVATGPQPMPTWFGVAVPHLGDAWRYNITFAGEWGFTAAEAANLTVPHTLDELAWLKSGTVRGGDGRMHEANLLPSGWVLAGAGTYVQRG